MWDNAKLISTEAHAEIAFQEVQQEWSILTICLQNLHSNIAAEPSLVLFMSF